jgi:hypothetical protein
MMHVNSNLTDIIYKYENKEFSWGSFDCCIFTAKIVEEFTGRELPYWKDVLNYKGYRSSVKALKKLGCNKIEDLPSIILGTDKKPISKVKHGEPVYYINEDGIGLLGICNGVRAYFLQEGIGLTTRPVEDCLYSWSIS